MAKGRAAAEAKEKAAKIKEYHEKVLKLSAQRSVEIMQATVAEGGRMRVDTGFMRATLEAQIGEGAFQSKDNPAPPRPDDQRGIPIFHPTGEVNLVIKGAKITDLISVGYTANYSEAREYGARGQPGDGFVRLAAQRWPQVVAQAAAEIKADMGL